IFGRYSDAPSTFQQRGAGTLTDNYSTVEDTKYHTQAVTAGSNQVVTSRLINELRFNYSRSRANSFLTLDSFGGAVPPSNSVLFPAGVSVQDSSIAFFGDLTPFGLKFLVGDLGDNLQQQINLADNLSYAVGAHQLKFGLDYRRMQSDENTSPYR